MFFSTVLLGGVALTQCSFRLALDAIKFAVPSDSMYEVNFDIIAFFRDKFQYEINQITPFTTVYGGAHYTFSTNNGDSPIGNAVIMRTDDFGTHRVKIWSTEDYIPISSFSIKVGQTADVTMSFTVFHGV